MTKPKQEQEYWDHVDDKQVAWEKIREKLGHTMPDYWIRTYHEKSVTFRSQKKGQNIKIMLDGTIHHDTHLGAGSYTSDVHGPMSIDAATQKVLELMAA